MYERYIACCMTCIPAQANSFYWMRFCGARKVWWFFLRLAIDNRQSNELHWRRILITIAPLIYMWFRPSVLATLNRYRCSECASIITIDLFLYYSHSLIGIAIISTKWIEQWKRLLKTVTSIGKTKQQKLHSASWEVQREHTWAETSRKI